MALSALYRLRFDAISSLAAAVRSSKPKQAIPVRSSPPSRTRVNLKAVYIAGMSKSRSEVLAESRSKGIVAGATTAGAVAAGVFVAPIAGVVVAVPAAVFVYKWWKHRAENGIKV